MESVMRHMAAGLNMPYELVLKDFSKTNYSSARAALLEAWSYFQTKRRWLRDQWLDPIYECWLEEAINEGRGEAPDYYNNRYAYNRCRWIFSGRGWVDPVKKVVAVEKRLAQCISTQQDECKEVLSDSQVGIPRLENLVRTIHGGKYKGTWLHQELAYELARWLSATFRRNLHKWADKRLKEENQRKTVRFDTITGFRPLTDAIQSALLAHFNDNALEYTQVYATR